MKHIRGPQTEPWSAPEQTMRAGMCGGYHSSPTHLLQNWIGAGQKRIVCQEEQQRRAFIQLPLQEAGLCSRRLQPLQDVFVVFKHPVADGF